MSQKDYVGFAKNVLGLEFKNIEILLTAMTHRSWLNEHRKLEGLEHNERLEFLGDAVLELVTTEYLYKNFPEEPEGIMTNWRSALVRTESIGDAAHKMGVWDFLRLSKGEKSAGKRAKLQILANAFEAIVGAVYVDHGYAAAKKVIESKIIVNLDEILESGSWQDAKSRLQELAQAREGHTPQYKVLKEEGPDHDKIFTVGAFVGGKKKGQGKGPSKQIAQQAAAEKALPKYTN